MQFSVSDIRRVQKQLMDIGYDLPKHGADGDAGRETRAAVRAFEEAHGLKADGLIDKAMVEALEKAVAQRVLPTTPVQPEEQAGVVLKRGDRHESVRQVQTLLDDLGYDVGKIDQAYGPKTEEAVRAFQTANVAEHGLTVTGRVDAKTLKALQSETAEKVTLKDAPVPAEKPENTEAGLAPEHAPIPLEKPKVTPVVASGTDAGASSDRTSLAVLRYGDRGGDVRAFKQGLVSLNYLSSDDFAKRPDVLDDVTQQAIRDFQDDQKIGIDGRVGPDTRAALTAEMGKAEGERLTASTPVKYEGPKALLKGPRMLDRDLTTEEKQLITRLVWGESRGEGPIGQQAVAENVINRFKDDRFPDSVHGVIYDVKGGRQYSPTKGGLTAYEDIPADFRARTDSMLKEVVAGERPQVTGGAVFFGNLDVMSAGNKRWFNTLSGRVDIGNHSFFTGNPDRAREGLRLMQGHGQAQITPAGDPVHKDKPDLLAAGGEQGKDVALSDQQEAGPSRTPAVEDDGRAAARFAHR